MLNGLHHVLSDYLPASQEKGNTVSGNQNFAFGTLGEPTLSLCFVFAGRGKGGEAQRRPWILINYKHWAVCWQSFSVVEAEDTECRRLTGALGFLYHARVTGELLEIFGTCTND